MGYKAIINGTSYVISLPFNYITNYNETLDSAKISISHVLGKLPIKINMICAITNNDNKVNNFATNQFYCVMIIDKFEELQLNIQDNYYNYTIDLISITKALEFNLGSTTYTITQSKLSGATQKTIQEEVARFNNLLSPKIKIIDNATNKTWKYAPMFTLSSDLQTRFSQITCPEFRFNTETYRELLNKLLLVDNCIAKVNNDFSIDYIDLSLKNIPNTTFNPSELSFISANNNGNSYANGLLLNLQNVISENGNADNVMNSCEYIGLRNYTQPIMSTANNNTELQLTNPIYQIKGVKLCGMFVLKGVPENSTLVVSTINMWLEIDITDLVLLSGKRKVLKYTTDTTFSDGLTPAQIIDLVKNQQAYTLQYEIGDTKITGFPTSVRGLLTNRAVIQNIVEAFTTHKVKYGYTYNNLVEPTYTNVSFYIDGLYNPQYPNTADLGANDPYSRLLFKVEYQTKGKVSFIAHKNYYDSDLLDRNVYDNQDSSMINDLYQGNRNYSKVERIGHNTYIIPTRVNSLSRIQNCPSNYNGLVLYRREMQVYDTYIECIYTAQEKYVLENYFTSIQSKQRAWQLAEDYYIRNDIDNYYIEFSNNAKSSSYENNNLSINLWTLCASSLITSYENYMESINYVAVNSSSKSGVMYFLIDLDKKQLGRSIALSYAFYDNVVGAVSVGDNAYDSFSSTGYLMDYTLYTNDNGENDTFTHYFIDKLNYAYLQDTASGYNHLPYIDLGIQQSASESYYNSVLSPIKNLPLVIASNEFALDSSIAGSYYNNLVKTSYNAYKDNKEQFALSTQLEYCSDNDNIIVYDKFVSRNTIMQNNNHIAKSYITDTTIYTQAQLATLSTEHSADGFYNNGAMCIGYYADAGGDNTFRIFAWVDTLGWSNTGLVCYNNDIFSTYTMPYKYYKLNTETKYLSLQTGYNMASDIVIYGVNENVSSKNKTIAPFIASGSATLISNGNLTISAFSDNVMKLTILTGTTSYPTIVLCDSNGNNLLAFNSYTSGIYYINVRKTRSNYVFDSDRTNVFKIGTITSELNKYE